MTRRRNYRNRILGLVIIFAAISTFTFIKNINNRQTVDAYSLERFDPGYIISDYVMGDYNSMTEEEIQAFLTSKNNCSNTNYEYYQYLSQNPNYQWHWKDDHFVCLSEELFGDGEIIGEGETAAHIIWQAAQDYQVNPKVLIVLIEKETSLITDKIPNNGDYRKATGYGCPDFAACSEKYYGFKNQVRNAANLFHTVLTGGWTNYPLGVNYIQYNPHSECGGSEVDIKSLATSALYRYTPYQPNEGALAAGYGTAYCGAYGNRNFYLYFGDWFGDPTITKAFVKVETPRYMVTIKDTTPVNPFTSEDSDLTVEAGTIIKFATKIKLDDDTWCIRSQEDTDKDAELCIKRTDLDEIEIEKMDIPKTAQEKTIKNGAKKINVRTGEVIRTYQEALVRTFPIRINTNSKTYYITEYEYKEGNPEIGFVEDDIEDIVYEDVITPRYMTVTKDTEFVVPQTQEGKTKIPQGAIFMMTTKIKDQKGKWCIRPDEQTENYINECIKREYLDEVNPFIEVVTPRRMQTINETKLINPYTLEEEKKIEKNSILMMTTKIIDQEGKWCIRAEKDSEQKNNLCIPRESLDEVEEYMEVVTPREMRVINDTTFINPQTQEKEGIIKKGSVLMMTTKIIDKKGGWCIRTEEYTNKEMNLCIPRTDLDNI